MDKDNYLRRLNRVEGQVRGLERMIEEDTYCVDVLHPDQQPSPARCRSISLGLLDEHVRHCVATPARGRRVRCHDLRGHHRGGTHRQELTARSVPARSGDGHLDPHAVLVVAGLVAADQVLAGLVERVGELTVGTRSTSTRRHRRGRRPCPSSPSAASAIPWRDLPGRLRRPRRPRDARRPRSANTNVTSSPAATSTSSGREGVVHHRDLDHGIRKPPRSALLVVAAGAPVTASWRRG